MILGYDSEWLTVQVDGRIAMIGGTTDPRERVFGIVPNTRYQWADGTPLSERERGAVLRAAIDASAAAQLAIDFTLTSLELAIDVAGVREPGFHPLRCHRPEVVEQLRTPPDSAVFWAGRPFARLKKPVSQVAREIADAEGGRTFEVELAGSGLDLPLYNPHDRESAAAWHEAMAAFAQGASGRITIVSGETVDPSSPFIHCFFPLLAENTVVTSAVVVDAFTRARRELGLR